MIIKNSSTLKRALGVVLGAVASISLIGFAAAQTTTSTVANLTISKTIDSATPPAGGTVNYLLTVSALGPATSTGVVANDALPLGLTFVSATPSMGTYSTTTNAWSLGTMTSGATATLRITATTNASDTVGQVITNTATVSEDPSLANNNSAQASSSAMLTIAAAATSTPSSTVAGLTILAGVDNAQPPVGSTIHYLLTVSALGPANSTGVGATDLLPSDLTFVSATPSVGTYDNTTGAWTIGTLTPNATATLSIAATVSPYAAGSETITDMATVGESPTLTNPNATQASTQVTVVVAQIQNATSTADLSLTKSIDVTTPLVGTTVHYTVTATNLGPASSTGVVVNDLLPVGLSFISAAPSTGSYNSTTGVWTIGTLTPNATATLSIAAMVNTSDLAGQTITNTASASESNVLSDPNSANNTASAMLTVVTSTIPTPTSTATARGLLSIGPNGNFLARGMIVTSVGSTSFQAQIWGVTYTINWSDDDGDEFLFRTGNTQFNLRANGRAISDEVVVGDIVNVSGFLSVNDPFVVLSNVVRNTSIISARPPHFVPVGNGNGFGIGNGNGYGNPNSSAGALLNSSGSPVGNDNNNGEDHGNGNGNGNLQGQLDGLNQQLRQLEQLFGKRFGR